MVITLHVRALPRKRIRESSAEGVAKRKVIELRLSSEARACCQGWVFHELCARMEVVKGCIDKSLG